jgi:hypothetical protein
MAMGTYGCTNHLKLVSAGHAKENKKSPQPEEETLIVSI